MKHPTEEQWMEFLYGESPAAERSEIQEHLKTCPLCQSKRATYGAVHKRLDTWKVEIPEKPRLAPQWSPMVKWAAAAALLVTTAFATGRFSKPSFDSSALEAKIARDLDLRVQEQAQVAAERALEAARQQLQSELALRMDNAVQKAMADTLASKEQVAIALAALREQDGVLYSALQELEAKHQTTLRSLREDLEKVALFTDESLRSAQRQLVQLASLTDASASDFSEITPQ